MASAVQGDGLTELLARLAATVNKLPSTLPKGREDGLLAQHFKEKPVDEDEGPWYSFNHAWERLFHTAKPREEQLKLVTRGPHGLKLCYDFVNAYATNAAMSSSDKILMAGKIEHLLDVVAEA